MEGWFEVMHAVGVRGIAEADDLANGIGADVEAVTEGLEALAAAGFAARRDGRLRGWYLTESGKRHHATQAASRPEAADARMTTGYEEFLTLNQPFKEVCTRWQLEDRPASCISELADLHGRVVDVLRSLAASSSRFGTYRDRFDAALARLVNGDEGAFTKPLTGSYHDIWMELHQDLLLTLGRPRSEADGH